MRLAFDLVWGDSADRSTIPRRLPDTPSDALITGKHGINFAPELAESTLVLARAIVDDPRRAIDDRINAAIGILWVHLFRGRGRAAIAVVDTISRLAKEAGRESQFGGWTGMQPAIPAFILLNFGYAPDTTAVLRFAKTAQDWSDAFLGAAVAAQLQEPVPFRRGLDIIKGLAARPMPPKPDSLDLLINSKDTHFARAVANSLMGLEALARRDSGQSLRLLQAGTDTLRAYGLASPFVTAALDLEIGKLLLTAGHLDQAEMYLIAGTDNPFSRVTSEFYLGLLAERRGQLAEARDHYQRVVRWWRGCDPELKPLWQEALQRSTREPR